MLSISDTKFTCHLVSLSWLHSY